MAVWAAEQRTRRPFQCEPSYLSPAPADTDVSAYLLGLDMLGVGMTPQGVHIAAVMEARDPDGFPLYDDVTVQLARRSAKTTSIQAVLLGRSAIRRGYRTIQTAQDGTRASGVIKQMIREMELEDPRPVKERPWLTYSSTGREYLEWEHGAHWHVVPPDPSSFRSKAADAIWFDEAGELDPAKTSDLEAGALPVLDTRDDGQVAKSGTPGTVRAGMFWNALDAARGQPGTLGIVDYSAREADTVTDEQIADPALWLAHHPGLASGLTKLATIQKRHDTMDLSKFIREYLCVWPPDTSRSALDLDRFDALTVPAELEPPDGFALSYDCEMTGAAAAVSAGWVDPDGTRRAQLLEHRRGTGWVVEYLARANARFPRARIAYDPIGQNSVVALGLARVPKFRQTALKPLTLRDMSAAAAVVAQGLDDETIRFGDDVVLRKSVENATWRSSGDSRLFGRRGGNDISGLISASAAVHTVVAERPRSRVAVPATVAG